MSLSQKYDRVTLLQLVEVPSTDDLLSDLDLTIEMQSNSVQGGIRLIFGGVHALSIQRLARPFQVGSLILHDVKSRQMEKLNYFVEDEGRQFLSFYCRTYKAESLPSK